MKRIHFWRILLLAAVILAGGTPAHALDAAAVRQLGAEDGGAKIEAINSLAATGDAAVIPLLRAMQDGQLSLFDDRVVVVTDAGAIDAVTGAAVAAPADQLGSIIVNNRIQRALGSALGALQLVSEDRAARFAAAAELSVKAGEAESMRPLIVSALEREADAEIRALLLVARAGIDVKSADRSVRIEAVRALGLSISPKIKPTLLALLGTHPDGSYVEPDAEIRQAAQQSLRDIEKRFVVPQMSKTLFEGLSLGSILLLAALGLAITFGLMGIINMAHGEMLMIGAYTTFVVQMLFRNYFPGSFDYYVVAAIPVAFVVTAAVGVLLERTVIRYLYGRPLETLLTTWGISLILIQLVRTIFGAQNVEVANPSWMSGGFDLGGDVILPYNRVVIVFFAAFVVLMVWWFLSRTRLGLYVRAVTQNRKMADCMGIPTPRVDWLTFGLGSGIAGLGGVALSQIGNVGPELGQGYIVDSFMVVVLGGVGQLAGTIIAAIGLGEINKFLEPFSGAVLGKIFVLVFIILFIQKRPQGLFALKGRAADN